MDAASRQNFADSVLTWEAFHNGKRLDLAVICECKSWPDYKFFSQQLDYSSRVVYTAAPNGSRRR